jgi:hypothetical protein
MSRLLSGVVAPHNHMVQPVLQQAQCRLVTNRFVTAGLGPPSENGSAPAAVATTVTVAAAAAAAAAAAEEGLCVPPKAGAALPPPLLLLLLLLAAAALGAAPLAGPHTCRRRPWAVQAAAAAAHMR